MKEKTFITLVAIVVIVLALIFILYFGSNLNGQNFDIPMPEMR